MFKFVLPLVASLCFLSCTPAELAKVEKTAEQIVKEVKCRAVVLAPYANAMTKEKIEEILTSKNAGEALKETLEAVEEDPAKVVEVVQKMVKCSDE